MPPLIVELNGRDLDPSEYELDPGMFITMKYKDLTEGDIISIVACENGYPVHFDLFVALATPAGKSIEYSDRISRPATREERELLKGHV